MTENRNHFVAIAFLALAVTGFFAQELFTDASLVTFRLSNVHPWLAEATREDLAKPSVTSDCTFSYYPRRVFATEMVRKGQMPFWNPHEFCGTPFFANFQSAVLYPVNVAMYWMDPAAQMDFFLYFHFLVAAVFSYALARKLGLSSAAGVISSISFTFCGFMATRLGQPTLVSTASWLPALVLFGERLIERPSLARAAHLGIVLSLCTLAGFPQLVLFNVYTLLTYVIVRLVLSRGVAWRVRGGVLLLVFASAFVAVLICAFQLLPTYELSTFSYRKVLPYSMILSSAHHKLVALKYFIPDVLGDPHEIGVISKALSRVSGGPRFTQNYVSTTGYVGLLPLLLAVSALLRPRRKLAPFAVLGAASLLAVFGSPLLRLFYHVLPGFSFSRVDRVVVVFMFAMSVLAGHGYDRVRRDSSARRSVVVAACFMAFAVALAVWLSRWGFSVIIGEARDAVSPAEYLGYASGKIYGFLAVAALCAAWLALGGLKKLGGAALAVAAVGVIGIDLVPKATMFKVSQPADGIVPRSEFVDMLKRDKTQWRFAKYVAEVMPSNTATLAGLDEIHGYDALNVRHFIEILGAIDSTTTAAGNADLKRRIGPLGLREALESTLLDLVNVKYVLTVARTETPRPTPIALVNSDCMGRAFLVGKPHFFPSYDDILAYMKAGGFDPRQEVLLVGDGPERIEGASVGDLGQAKITESGASDVTVEVEAASPSYLVVSDVFYPGWRAYVDGTERTILRADYAFRGIEVPAGAHTVRMAYRPSYFAVGVLFSVAGLCLVAVMLTSGRARRAEGGLG